MGYQDSPCRHHTEMTINGDEHVDLRSRWERRAAHWLADRRGVLLAGLAEAINDAIHRWHELLLQRYFAATIPAQGTVADLAAGYGRLSATLRRLRPDVSVVGLDFCLPFCVLYSQKVGNSVCADIARLPLMTAAVDGVLVVTGLMYLDATEASAAVEEMLRCVKRGGSLLFVDPGRELLVMLQRLGIGKASETGGQGFTGRQYRELFNRPGCTIMHSGGNALFTLFLPLLMVLGKMPMLSRPLAKFLVLLDLLVPFPSRLALHRWVVVRRDG